MKILKVHEHDKVLVLAYEHQTMISAYVVSASLEVLLTWKKQASGYEIDHMYRTNNFPLHKNFQR